MKPFTELCLQFLLPSLLTVACSVAAAQNENFSIDVQRIDTNVFVYHFTINADTQAVEENGLIVEGKDSVVVVETPWDLTQTIQLINWITEHLKKPIGIVIVTHPHPNQLGGLSVLLNDQFPIYGSVHTAQEAKANGFRLPDYQFLNDTTFHCSGITAETYYPKAGHDYSNVVFYFSGSDILFGGNFLKDTKSNFLGVINGTDVSVWMQGLQRLKEKYPHPKIIIPEHGNWEGVTIETTEKLLQNAVKNPAEQ